MGFRSRERGRRAAAADEHPGQIVPARAPQIPAHRTQETHVRRHAGGHFVEDRRALQNQESRVGGSER